VVLAALLALMRFVTVSAALDTGSSFEGMGASREVQFSALAEPALLVSFAVLARQIAGGQRRRLCDLVEQDVAERNSRV
jgi:formate hydrogenlyase subunit 4